MKKKKIKKNINTFIWAFCIYVVAFNFQSALGKEVYLPNNKFPLEFVLLIQSLQKIELTDEEKKDLIKNIAIIDQIAAIMSKEEIFFIIKTEIYKAILNKYKDEKTRFKLYRPENIVKLKDFSKRKFTALLPFANWMARAIQSDMKVIIKSHLFNKLINHLKRTNLINNSNLRKVKRRLSLLLPWYQKLSTLAKNDIDELMKEFMIECLRKITFFIKSLAQFTQEKELAISPKVTSYKFFKKFDLSSIRGIPKSYDILTIMKFDDEVKTAKQTLTESSKWKPSKEVLPKGYPTPSPNYVPPEVLPQPVDDWMPKEDKDTSKISKRNIPLVVPTIDPKYVPPKNLPKPAENSDDWLLQL